MPLRIAIAADHGGFVMKTGLVPWLESQGFDLVDLGSHVFDSEDDYPDFSVELARAIVQGRADRGILICGSGVGASIAANKIQGIRACLCHDFYSAHQGVEHDDMNVLCLGGRVIGIELAKDLISAFLKAEFIRMGKYQRRVEKVKSLDSSLQSAKSLPPDLTRPG